jgi:hypothetical protein
VVHGYDQRPAVGSQYRFVPHLHLWDSFDIGGVPFVKAISISALQHASALRPPLAS